MKIIQTDLPVGMAVIIRDKERSILATATILDVIPILKSEFEREKT